MKNVVIYARAGSAAALECQLHLLKDHAEAQGWTVSEVYSDIARGNVRKRAGLDRLIADAKSGKVGVILVADLSRLFRGREFVPAIYNDLMSGKIGLVTLDFGFLNSNNDHCLLSLVLYFHWAVIEQHGQRIAFAKEFRKRHKC